MQQRIRAHIDPTAISKVSRFFDSSTQQIVNEMLQNARRARASTVDIDVGPTRMTITDDGRGIPDPRTLLAFGQSGWDEKTTRNEDPAGMGFFSLARRDAIVDSAPAADKRGSATPPPWRVELRPAHFVGECDAEILRARQAPTPHGTRITFSHQGKTDEIDTTVRNTARYSPLTVTLNGERIERADFFRKVVHVEEYRGVRIGVRHAPTPAWDRPCINFHGLLIHCDTLPVVRPVDERNGRTANPWWVMLDVVECPELELVLPTRNAVVKNWFLARLAQAAREAIHRAILAHGGDTRLARKDALDAREAGILIPDPPAELHAWKPRTANQWTEDDGTRDVRARPVAQSDGSRPLLMTAKIGPADQQVMARACERNGILDRIFHPRAGLEGYPWYADIERITGVAMTMEAAGRVTSLTETTPARDNRNHRVDRITVELEVENAAGVKRTISLETDAAFHNPANAELPEEIRVVLTRDAGIDAAQLTRLMTRAFFCASDDAEADSVDTQEAAFERQCRLIATSFTRSETEARTMHLSGLVRDYLGHAVKNGEELTVRRDATGDLHIAVNHASGPVGGA